LPNTFGERWFHDEAELNGPTYAHAILTTAELISALEAVAAATD
jgi:hypothetical protein